MLLVIACIFSIFINFHCVSGQDPLVGQWPDKFYSWVMTTVNPPGQQPTVNFGNMVVYDSLLNYSCRFNEQNILNLTGNRPIDYCVDDMHYAITDGSGNLPYSKVNCSKKEKKPFTVLSWPTEFLDQNRFLGVDKVNQVNCNHFFAPSVALDGRETQMDVWTAVNDGAMCKIALRDIETEYITAIAFDGFQSFIPKEALQCTTAQIKCARDDWVCSVKKGVSQNAIISGLSWVCGQIDCAPINRGGAHFQPDTPLAHGNWAFNAYYQKNKYPGGILACDFGGICELAPPPKSRNNQVKSSPVKRSKNMFTQMFSEHLAC